MIRVYHVNAERLGLPHERHIFDGTMITDHSPFDGDAFYKAVKSQIAAAMAPPHQPDEITIMSMSLLGERPGEDPPPTGDLAERINAALATERERLCAAIKAADDKAADNDYMLDSNDCISVIRGTWNPDFQE